MKALLFKLKCLTNLHVGSGESNYSLIDNEVEKDPILGQPVIFASGMKGALRDYFKQENKQNEETYVSIFGSETTEQGKSKPGNLKFLEASLLARPMRASRGDNAYYMVTSKKMLMRYFDLYEKFKISNDKINIDQLILELKELDNEKNYKFSQSKEIAIEGIQIDNVALYKGKSPNGLLTFLNDFIGEEVVIMGEEALKQVSLPIIARNKLENGESKHLWYEEIVPHESVFYFYVLGYSREEGKEDLAEFVKVVNEKVIQFGGNATIGYGLSYVTKEGESIE